MAINLPIVSKFDSKGVEQAKSGINQLGDSAKKMGLATKVAIAGAAVAVTGFALSSMKAAADAEAVSRGLYNAAQNAKIFGTTETQISSVTQALTDHSAKLSALTGIDDEYLDSLKRGWLSVPNIAKLGISGINNLSEIAVNIAAQAGKDSEGVAQALSRVFSNPEQAMKRLQKAGVYLSDSQKATYNSILKTGGAAKAQAYLIDELQTKYKGAAEAAADPFKRLQVIFENLKETVGAALLPAFSKLVDALGPLFDKIGPIIAQVFGALGPVFDVLGPIIDTVAAAFTKLEPTLTALMSTIGDIVMMLLPPLNQLFAMLIPIINQLVPPLLDLVMIVLKPLIALFQVLMTALQPIIDAVLPVLVDLFRMVGEQIQKSVANIMPTVISLITQLAPIIGKLLAAVLPLLPKLFELGMKLLMPIAEIMMKLIEKILPFLIPLIDGLSTAIGWLVDNFLTPLIDGLTQAVDWFTKLLGLDGKEVKVKGSVIKLNNDGSTDHDNNPATKMAQGGIVMPRPGGLFANIAEAGQPEAVIPLDRLGDMVGGNGNAANINITVNAGLGANGAQIGAEIVSAIKRYERTSGPVFAKA